MSRTELVTAALTTLAISVLGCSDKTATSPESGSDERWCVDVVIDGGGGLGTSGECGRTNSRVLDDRVGPGELCVRGRARWRRGAPVLGDAGCRGGWMGRWFT